MQRACTILGLLLLATRICAAQPAPEGAPPPPPGEEGRPPRHHPPLAAFAACTSKQADATCSFTQNGQSVAGTCWAPPGKKLACRPNTPPDDDAAPPDDEEAPPPPG